MAEPGGMSEYLGVFLDEADEQVDTLDQGLLRLEKEPENQDLLQAIFRAAHSLKSASAAMGFVSMSRLTHAAENVLDGFRTGDMRPDTTVIDALLAAVDALKTMKDAIRVGGDVGQVGNLPGIEAIAAQLESAGKQPGPESAGVSGLQSRNGACGFGAEAPKHQQVTVESPAAESQTDNVLPPQNAREVVVRLSADCQMRSIRAHLVLNALESIGRVLRTDPPREEIAAGRLSQEFRVVLAYDGETEAVHRVLESVSEVEHVDIASDPRVVDVGPAGRGKPAREVAAMARRADQTVRVNVARLDNLMNLVGELVIDRTRVSQLGLDLEARCGNIELVQHLKEAALHMGRIVGDLQEEVMKARMLPIAQLFQRFPRMVRDLARKMGKEVELILEGEDTELDRSVIEEMVDPLTHLLRNAVDHGAEEPDRRERSGKPRIARIILSARQPENHIVVEVTDDGAGIDVEQLKESAVRKGVLSQAAAAALSRDDALQLAFAPGLSTASAVSDVSGRGVGMDVVKSNVSRLHGSVRIRTKTGMGTTVAVSLPLTLAISQSLLVTVGQATAAIPLVYVVETARVPRDELYTIQGRLVMPFRGRVLPLVALSEVLQRDPHSVGDKGLIRIVVTRSGDQEIGLIVDTLVGEQEVVLKPLGPVLGDTVGISGATILGNGTVALVLDVASLIDRGGVHAALAAGVGTEVPTEPERPDASPSKSSGER